MKVSKNVLWLIIPGGLAVAALWWLSRFLRSSLGVFVSLPDMPLGIRQNNPGNLSYLDQNTGQPIPWQGIVGYGLDAGGKQVAKFDTPVNGIRAMVKNFIGYKQTTLRAIATEWVGDWTQTDYVSNAAFGAGLQPDVVLNLRDPETVVKVAKGITTAENGQGPWYTEATYLQGVNAAGVK